MHKRNLCIALSRGLTLFLLLGSLISVARAQSPETDASQSTLLSEYWKKSMAFPPAAFEAAPVPLPTTFAELLAKAKPDECFNGVGQPYPPGPPCSTGQPKVNQAYIWGMTRAGQKLWFGTMSNTLCLVFSTFLGLTTPQLNSSWVCEFGSQHFSPALPPALGDFRPPRVYTYDTTGKILTPVVVPDPRIGATLGLRAAGNLNNVVLLAGPGLPAGVNFFAFRADTGAYLGSANLPAYNNIRRILPVGGVLYATMGNTGGTGGTVLRWTGSVASPFTFDIVGTLETSCWEMTGHEGRLFVTTFPSNPGLKQAALFMSPLVPPGGLTNAHAGSWTRIWKANDYEPDPVTAATYGGGALASFGGYLYWGTMHVPLLSTLGHIATYSLPTTNQDFLVQLFMGSERAISIFRASGFGGAPAIELLYGSPQLPVFTPPNTWTMTNNNMGQMPQWGPPGFGNPFNNYTWTMELFDNRLFVGTMDWSYLFAPLANQILGMPITLPTPPQAATFGADLFYFPAVNSPALPENISGLGNFTNYGLRTMIPGTASLFVGTANPMNLMTSATDALPEGGWELVELTRRPHNTPAGYNVQVSLDGGVLVTFCNVTQAGMTAAAGVPNPFDPDPIPPPSGYLKPSTYYAIGSTADWRSGYCATNRQAYVCVPAPNPYAQLFQLQYNHQSGAFEWVNITVRNAGGSLCGWITKDYMGVLAVMGPSRLVPTLSEWGLILLCSALIVAGAYFLSRKPFKVAAG